MNIIVALGIIVISIPFGYWSFFRADNIDHEAAALDDEKQIEELEKELHENS